ncbi:MAG: DUF167 domain-containing protein [Alphaproteobacteria bacterium]
MNSFYEKAKNGLIIRIKLAPKAKQNSFNGVFVTPENETCLKVSVTQAPEDNKANKALIELLSSKIGLAKSNFEIITGKTSKNKKILILGNLDFLEKKLEVLFNEFGSKN